MSAETNTTHSNCPAIGRGDDAMSGEPVLALVRALGRATARSEWVKATLVRSAAEPASPLAHQPQLQPVALTVVNGATPVPVPNAHDPDVER
jgi:hypothetical protein